MSGHLLESKFKRETKKILYDIFPGCYLHDLECNVTQGIPDLLILYRDKWAMLEFKESEKAKRRPNQDYYVDLFDDMSFARFIYPENREEVLDELQSALRI